MNRLGGIWGSRKEELEGITYLCGYCDVVTSPVAGYESHDSLAMIQSYKYTGRIMICPNCNRPTFVDLIKEEQYPGQKFGDSVESLPSNIETLYNEARNCFSVNAFTSSVLSLRKLLMNIAVSVGAEPGKKFAHYVDFLNDNHFIPPGSKDWVDHIRKKGNVANHEIPNMTKEDAEEILGFIQMLLQIVYEMPGRMKKANTQSKTESSV
ncbi:DUF4145 domain-containing protein [Bhargavaea ginsengi]|uniref:DUF4145 domain-containing protein n=1 Tax=Bhargavaea ginsengi TaxID=426757 RepID=UPI00203BC961|nr:DUF4145 domain-containing protein [Bhargavaea ginsengi]MCM3089143.1 DUF4145 domain-containing protein [Bhargavaea ginsengi]